MGEVELYPEGTSMAETDYRISIESADTDALIEFVRCGDHIAFAELMSRYDDRIRRTAYAILKNLEDVDDAIQETYLRVFGKVHPFQGTSAFSTWVTRIAINTSLMRLRQKRARPAFSIEALTDGDGSSFLPLSDASPSPEQVYLTSELKTRLHEAMGRLPAKYKDIIQDQIYSELPVRDLAEKRGLTIAAAKSRVCRARKILLGSADRQPHRARSMSR
jgi:RNA polymerase sigma-70 factor (ECF subfamily)